MERRERPAQDGHSEEVETSPLPTRASLRSRSVILEAEQRDQMCVSLTVYGCECVCM